MRISQLLPSLLLLCVTVQNVMSLIKKEDFSVQKTCILQNKKFISNPQRDVMRLAGDCQEGGRRDGPLLYARFTHLIFFVAASVSPYRYNDASYSYYNNNNNYDDYDDDDDDLNDSSGSNNMSTNMAASSMMMMMISFNSNAHQKDDNNYHHNLLQKTEIEDTIIFAAIDDASPATGTNANHQNTNNTNTNRIHYLIFGDEWRIISAPIIIMTENNNNNITALAVGPVAARMLILAIDNEGRGRLWYVHNNNNDLVEDDSFLTTPYFLTACIHIKNRMYAAAACNTLLEVQLNSHQGFMLVPLLQLGAPGTTTFISDEAILFYTNNDNELNHPPQMPLGEGTPICQFACDIKKGEVKVLFADKEWRCIPMPPGGGTFLKPKNENATTFVFEPCQPGTFAFPFGTRCRPCPRGTVAPVKGAVTCTACPLSAQFSDAWNIECLVFCPEHYNPEQCTPCPLEGYQWSAQNQQCEPCPPMTAAAWAKPCTLCATASGAGAKECAVFDQIISDSSYFLYTLAHFLPAATAIAASAQNGTLWIATEEGAIYVVLPQFDPYNFWEESSFHIAIGGSGGWCLSLSRDEASLYAYNGGDTLVRLEMGTTITKYAVEHSGYSMMCIGFWAGKNEERVFWKSSPNSIDAFWPGAAITRHFLPAEVDGFVAHIDGTLLVFYGGSLWKMWPATGGLFPMITTKNDALLATDSFLSSDANNNTDFDTVLKPQHQMKLSSYWDESILTLVPNLLSEFNFDVIKSQQQMAFIRIDGGGQMLLFIDKGNVHALYTRSINMECNVNTYRHPSLPACLPCPSNTYAAAGALACAPLCSPGNYYYDSMCVPCPTRGWWRSDSILRACRPMQDTLAQLRPQQSLYTFAEIQRFFLDANEIICDFPLFDLFLYANNNNKGSDIFKTSDMLGRFWHTTSDSAATTIMIQKAPAIWIFCCSTETDVVCSCNYFLGGTQRHSYGRCNNNYGGGLFRLDTNQTRFELASHNNNMTDNNDKLMIVKCWVGWPAQYECASPAYVWSGPTTEKPKGECLPCPAGTLVAGDGSCAISSAIVFTCAPGFFLHFLPRAASQRRVCMRCNLGTYSTGGLAEKCTQHAILFCPIGEYILLNEDASAEHICVPCQQCAPDEMIIFLQSPPSFFWDDERTLCTTGGVQQPYICASAVDSIAGFFITLILAANNINNAAANNNSDAAATNHRQLRFDACNVAPPQHSIWAAGPRQSSCYFRCKYGINPDAVERYATAALFLTTTPLFISKNFFEYYHHDHDAEADEICATCQQELSGSDENKKECGPPCLLKPWLCDDVTLRCGSIPENAALKNVENCIWACNEGFLFSDARKQCLPCLHDSCELGEAFSPDSCTCSPCGGGASAKRGYCSCDPANGFFSPPASFLNGTCLPCKKRAFCPAGKRVEQLCALDPCGPCPEPYNTLQGTAILTPTFDAVCRIQCKPGHHPVHLISGDIILNNEALDPSEVSCEPCSLRPLTPCPSACFLGDAVVAASEGCKKCMRNEDCPNAGTFAAPCTNGLPQPSECIDCSWKSAMHFFVPRSPQKCLTACIADSFEQEDGTCIPCSNLPMVPNAPFVKYYALFAAKPGPRWWPPEFDPPHLPIRSMVDPLLETRAGVCWPCPIGTLPHSFASLEVFFWPL